MTTTLVADGVRVIDTQRSGFEPSPVCPVFVVAQCHTYCSTSTQEAEQWAKLFALAPKMRETLENLRKYAEIRVRKGTGQVPSELIIKLVDELFGTARSAEGPS
jgi:hypothetical protein